MAGTLILCRQAEREIVLAPFDDGDVSLHNCIEEGFILSASVCDSDISSWYTDDDEDGSDVFSLQIDDEVFWLDETDYANDVVMHEERSIDTIDEFSLLSFVIVTPR